MLFGGRPRCWDLLTMLHNDPAYPLIWKGQIRFPAILAVDKS